MARSGVCCLVLAMAEPSLCSRSKERKAHVPWNHCGRLSNSVWALAVPDPGLTLCMGVSSLGGVLWALHVQHCALEVA